MVEDNGYKDATVTAILRELALNPRISFRRLSQKLGLTYPQTRFKILSLLKKNMISFGLLISPEYLGRDVAVVKLKTDHPDHVLTFANRCPRVLLAIKVNNGEVLLVIRGKNKQETLFVVESLRSRLTQIREIVVEYGTLPRETLILAKVAKNDQRTAANNEIDCNPEHDCKKCAMY